MASSSERVFQEAKSLVHWYYYWMVEIAIVKVFIDHTASSKRLHEDRIKLLFRHIFDFFLVPAAQWPEYFNHHGLREPPAANWVPFGLTAGHPEKTLYEVLETRPKRGQKFNRAMQATVEGMPATGMALLVDVGGGKGQALKAILAENPRIPASRCVLQDQTDVIRQAVLEVDEALGPVKKVALRFLSNVHAACARDSKVLISEQLLPDVPSLDLAAFDIWMLNFGK
ncbi:S-adenosyl-L-methionine-dependent methyltransferase [Xylariaceae sp. AK1471]|nr:S-adenosyl-L-methionine-dependent methyltransferase [Xylariaceae sp. AK1471]